MRCVLRSGALWKDSIGELAVEVVADRGVRVLHSSLPLRGGRFVRHAYEPARDLDLVVAAAGR